MKSKTSSVNLLQGPILKSLVIFMIPIMISNIFQQLYNAVDTAIVGNFLGENSLAAIGACASIFELFVGFAMSLASGFGIVAARSYGSGNEENLKKCVAGSLVIGGITTLVITLISLAGLRPLLHLISTPEEILEESYAYIHIISLWLFVMFAYNLFSGLLRSIGNSVMPLVFLIISSMLNIFLDILCITTFQRGVAGAAIATVIAQGVSVVLCIVYIYLKTPVLVPSLQDFKFDKEMYKDLAGQGYAMAFMGSIVSSGSIILQSGINKLGTDIIAGHVAARKVYAIGNLPMISMGIAMSTFIGQNKGANQGDRILKAMKLGYLYDIVAAAMVSLIFWTCGSTFISMISGSTNPVILSNGSRFLYVVGPFYAVLGVLMQTRFALQGLGSKWIPLISSCIEFVGKVLFTMILIPMFGYTAVIFCEPIIWCVMAAQLVYSFHRNPYVIETKHQMQAVNLD